MFVIIVWKFSLDSIVIICDFHDVFPANLLGLPPECDIEFVIYLESNI